MEENIKKLKGIIDGSDNIVFFGGAGVSTESGVPDFRSVDGLYNQEYAYPPETILSHSFYRRNPEEFYRFYRNKMLFPNAEPNIDGLHQAAGSKNVYELHGSVHRNHCQDCGKFYGFDQVYEMEGIPRCQCGGIIKPDVVLYEEGLDQKTIQLSVEAIAKADVLIIGGTSLAVYPAAGLVDYYRGNKLVLINKSKTQKDQRADLVINQPIGEVLGQVVEL